MRLMRGLSCNGRWHYSIPQMPHTRVDEFFFIVISNKKRTVGIPDRYSHPKTINRQTLEEGSRERVYILLDFVCLFIAYDAHTTHICSYPYMSIAVGVFAQISRGIAWGDGNALDAFTGSIMYKKGKHVQSIYLCLFLCA